jgi:hypothetical protein
MFTIENWRFDGYRWKQNGRSQFPRKNPEVDKRHYVIRCPGNELDGGFKKLVYKLIHEESAENKVIVHYVGDETLACDFSHGEICCCMH